jgi:transposase
MRKERTTVMGIKERDFAPLPPLSLEGLVPPDHFYRHLERRLDLGFVRGLVRDAYADIGRPSIDPVVSFKLQLVLFFEDLRSERQLLRVVADRLSLRWYLGYDLTEPLPDHSSLTRIRERYGLAVFRRFFEAITEQCVEAGLVWGQEFYVDATKVEANAALESLHPRFAVEAHLGRLFGDPGAAEPTTGADEQEPAPERPTPLQVALTEPACAALMEVAAARHDWIGAAGRPDRTETSGAYRRTADVRVSATDPDASPMPLGDGRTHLGYRDHDVVDEGKARVVLMALVTPAEVQENQPALDLLWRARFRWKLHPRQVTGDTKYGTVENVAAIEREDIRAYVPLSEVGHRPGLFRDTDVVYDAATDTGRCPGDETLRVLPDPPADRPGAGQCLHGLRVPGAVHDLAARPTSRSQSRRGVFRPGARLSRDRALRQGHAHAQGLGGAALRRGQGLAWPTPLSITGRGEGQQPSPADRRGPEPHAPAQQAGVGPAAMAGRSSRGRAVESVARQGGPPVTERRLTSGGRPCRNAAPASAPFFNRLGRY